MVVHGELSKMLLESLISLVEQHPSFSAGRIVTDVWVRESGEVEVYTLPGLGTAGSRWGIIYVCARSGQHYEVLRTGYS
jgi:hypothetical protein